MKKIICSEQRPEIAIKSRLAPQLILLEPYVGESIYRLEVSKDLIEGLAFPGRVRFTHWSQVPKNSTFIVTKEGRYYATYLVLSYEDQIVSLEGENGALLLKGNSGMSRLANQRRSALLSMQGEDLYAAVQKTWLQALLTTGGVGKPAYEKERPRWFDRLGFIADGKKDHSALLLEVDRLLSDGFPIGFVVIREGWQDTTGAVKKRTNEEKLLSFEADPIRYPEGISQLVEDLRELGIPYIGVEHAMMGAKGGIHASLAKRYDLPPDQEGRYFLGYDMGRTFGFYHDYYSRLREMGISFVQVSDQQSPFSFYRNNMDVTNIYKNLQIAMQAAGSVHFHSSHFNVDCLTNANLFYWGHSSVAEVSPSKCIVEALQNSSWMQTLAVPDMGVMGKWPIFSALSKSLCKIDHSSKEIKQMIEKIFLPDGRALEPDYPLKLCTDSFFRDPFNEKVAYKAFTTKGESGFIATCNLFKETVEGKVSPKDIPTLIEESYAITSYSKGFLGSCLLNESFSFQLEVEGSDLFTFSPIHRGVAVIGMLHYYLSTGPIIETDIEEDNVHISAAIGRPIFLYCERDVLEVRRNGGTIPWEYDNAHCTLLIDSDQTAIDSHANYTITFS